MGGAGSLQRAPRAKQVVYYRQVTHRFRAVVHRPSRPPRRYRPRGAGPLLWWQSWKVWAVLVAAAVGLLEWAAGR